MELKDPQGPINAVKKSTSPRIVIERTTKNTTRRPCCDFETDDPSRAHSNQPFCRIPLGIPEDKSASVCSDSHSGLHSLSVVTSSSSEVCRGADILPRTLVTVERRDGERRLGCMGQVSLARWVRCDRAEQGRAGLAGVTALPEHRRRA